jgi:hypothetical protein
MFQELYSGSLQSTQLQLDLYLLSGADYITQKPG